MTTPLAPARTGTNTPQQRGGYLTPSHLISKPESKVGGDKPRKNGDADARPAKPSRLSAEGRSIPTPTGTRGHSEMPWLRPGGDQHRAARSVPVSRRVVSPRG